MDPNDLEYCINHGDLEYLLEFEHIDPKDLLNYLALHPKKNKEQYLAYFYLCRKLDVHCHFINNEHILLIYPELTLIAASFGLSMYFPLKEKYTVNDLVSEHSQAIIDTKEDEYYCFILIFSKVDLELKIDPMFQARVGKEFKKNSEDKIKYYINTDWLHKSIVNYSLELMYSLLINRLQEIRKNSFYFNCMKNKYSAFFETLKRENFLIEAPQELLNILSQDFNWEFSNTWRDKFFLIGPLVSDYLLGLEIISRAVSRVEKKNLVNSLDPEEEIDNGISCINETDTLGEKIKGYSVFDVSVYQEDQFTYGFTRAEYPFLLEKQINPYTDNPLKAIFINYLSYKLEMAKLFRFPESEPLKVLRKKLLEGNLVFQRTKE